MNKKPVLTKSASGRSRASVAKAALISLLLLALRVSDSQPHCAGGCRHLSQRCLGWGDSRVDEHGQIFSSRHQLKQEFQPLRCQFGRQVIEACHIAPRSGETINKTDLDWVFANTEDDWDRRRRRLCRQCSSIAEARDHGHPPSSQIGCHFRQLI